jgi:hypothetical protein
MAEEPNGQIEPVYRDWYWATSAARKAFTEAWDAGGPAAAVKALESELRASVKGWEQLDYPDVMPPPSATAAVRDLSSAAGVQHRFGKYQATVAGDPASALDLLKDAVSEAIDLELLNDLAVMLHAAGRYDAVDVLRACLVVDPGRDDARANLGALLEGG